MPNRRRFNHLFEEVSVAIGHVAPRYALWLALQEQGLDPEALRRRDVLEFADRHLEAFLAEHEFALRSRHLARLRRCLDRFDPRHPTPYETMERLGASRP